MRIGDHLTPNLKSSIPHPAQAESHALPDSYVLTHETGEICARILRRLACYAEPQPGGFFLTGERGVGKSRLLRHVSGILSDPKDPSREALHPYLSSDSVPLIPLNTIFIDVSPDPSTDLGRFLQQKLDPENPLTASGSDSAPEQISSEEFAVSMRRSAAAHAGRSLGILVLDDISRRLDSLSEPSSLEREFSLLKILLECFAERGALVFMIMDERHLKWDVATGIQMSILDSLGNSCDFIWLSRNHIVDIIATSVTGKSDAQKLEIRGILNRLRRKLPHLGAKAENFIDLYPIHPDTFYALFSLRALLPRFSPIGFAQKVVQDVFKRPAELLVTLDDLFDQIENELRGRREFDALMRSYDHVHREVIPHLKPAVQQKALRLLKGITFLTLCESQPPTVMSLANSLLLYDESHYLASYSLTSAILTDLEHIGGKSFSVEGEKFERCYRLIEAGGEANLITAKQLLSHDNEFPAQFPVLVFEWLHTEIPAWLPDTNIKLTHNSQSLVVPIPDRENGAKGLVFLKSIYDPLWSHEDLVALEESSYPWVLLIVSPYERFYEYEQALHELGARLSRLIVWHPDIPAPEETERLQGLAARQIMESARPEGLSPQAGPPWSEARAEAHEILRSLYVDRGRLIVASVQWSIGDNINDLTLSQYLAGQLSILEEAFFAGAPARAGIKEGSTPVKGETARAALHWAGLLSGKADTADPVESRNSVLQWWSQVEASGLSAGLQHIPDAFLTVQFWDYVKSYEAYLDSIRPLLIRLRSADADFFDTMVQLARVFNNEEERLQIWKQSLENLSGLLRWLPSFEHQRDYLHSAVPTGEDPLETLRNQLLDILDRPQQFLQSINRDAFEQNFLRFKKGYVEYYAAMHEDALHIIGNPEKLESKVDYIALRNLEMLSNLNHADKSYVNRVRIIGKWVQVNQCDFPVREILEGIPRCYCNFSPVASSHLRDSVTQMNAIIQDGIHYFRAFLRNCRLLIIQELKSMQVDDFHSRQIASLLSNGRMIALEPPTVEILNRIIQRHPRNFQAGNRANKSRPVTPSR